MNRFLGTDQIYRRAIGSHRAGVALLLAGGMMMLFFIALPIWFLLTWSPEQFGGSWALGFIGLVGLFGIVRGLGRKIIIHRITSARRYLETIDLARRGADDSRAGASVLYQEARLDRSGRRSADSFKAQVLEKGDGWWLYDATSIVHNDKGAPAAERCYTALEIKLRQPTPHLVFDGRDAKGRQFQKIYAASQHLKGVLGDQFDRRFVTYSPRYHTIDTLSFITPEVIEAMLALGGCDVEFVDNSLLCYTSFLPAGQIGEFKRRCFDLHARVNDNLRQYQPPEEAVEPFARRLQRNYRGRIFAGVLMILVATAVVVGAIMSADQGVGELFIDSIVVWVSGVATLVSGLRGRQRNRQAEREFLRAAGGG